MLKQSKIHLREKSSCGRCGMTAVLIPTFLVAKRKVNAITNTVLRICEGKTVKTKVPPK